MVDIIVATNIWSNRIIGPKPLLGEQDESYPFNSHLKKTLTNEFYDNIIRN